MLKTISLISSIDPHSVLIRTSQNSRLSRLTLEISAFQFSDVISDFTIFQNVLLAKIGKEKKSYNFYSSIDSVELSYEEIKTILLKIDLWDEREKPASLLSHGERRQLEIGIALALDPKLILLDEPMAGLSLDKIEKMKVIFNQIKDDVPILLIEHNMDVVFSIANRISVLVNGKIIDNWVMVDFPHVAAQLGHDLFNGEGWEAYDRGEKSPPRPEN